MVHMPHWPKKTINFPAINDLSRMFRILAHFGNPHLSLPPVIHVAGTNGKGSTCAMLAAIFQDAGYSAHIYTSPHLVQFNERIILNGQKIDDDFLFKILEKTRIGTEKIGLELSFFEAITVASFLAFSIKKADVLILETGLGGRIDATNVVQDPMITIITPISYDHMEFLGPRIELIAHEKAGIIKKNTPCIISMQEQIVMDILLQKCEELHAEAIAYEYDFVPKKNKSGFYFYSLAGNIQFSDPNLIGNHQIINASSVIAAILKIRKQFNISENNIKSGLTKIRWPGRLQKFDVGRVVKNPKNSLCWLDGAHNIAGASAVCDWLEEQNFKDLVLLVGFTKNRDVASILSQFKKVNPKIFGVRVLSEPSSYTAEALIEKAREAHIELTGVDSIEEAFMAAVEYSENARIIVTGSLFLVADCLKINLL